MRASDRALSIVAGLALAAVSTAAVHAPARALPVYPRENWSVGIGLGLGRGELEAPDGTTSEGLEGPSPQWRASRKLGTHWALGVEYEGWFHETGDDASKLRRSLQFFGLGMSWYPGNPENAWAGLYLRAAAGIGFTRVATVYLNEEHEQIDQVAEDDSGPGLVLAGGYEFWLARNATVGLGTSVAAVSTEGEAVKSGWFAPLSFFFNVRF